MARWCWWQLLGGHGRFATVTTMIGEVIDELPFCCCCDEWFLLGGRGVSTLLVATLANGTQIVAGCVGSCLCS
jgi:hypothetical protein